MTKEQKKDIESKVKLFIGIPHNHDEMKNEFRICIDRMKSFIGGEWYVNHQGLDSYVNSFGWAIHYETEFPISVARNNIATVAKENGFTHVLMLDSDMKFDFDLPYKLLLHDKECIAPLMKIRYADENKFFNYAHFYYEDNKVNMCRITLPFNGIVEDKRIFSGTGCLLFKTSILDKIEFPYFNFVIKYFDEHAKKVIGEDAYFGIQLVKNGVTTCIDTDIIVGHLATIPIPYEAYYMNSTGLQLKLGEINGS